MFETPGVHKLNYEAVTEFACLVVDIFVIFLVHFFFFFYHSLMNKDVFISHKFQTNFNNNRIIIIGITITIIIIELSGNIQTAIF